jgi:hypothetical protein
MTQKSLMITKESHDFLIQSRRKNSLPLSFLFLHLPTRSSVTVYGYTFPQFGCACDQVESTSQWSVMCDHY